MTLTSWTSLDGNIITQVRTCDVKWAYPQGSKWFIEWLDQRTGGIRQQEIDETNYDGLISLVDVTTLQGFDAPYIGVIKISPENIVIATESASPAGTILKYDIGSLTYSLVIEESVSDLSGSVILAGSGGYTANPHSINNGSLVNSPAFISNFKIKNLSYVQSSVSLNIEAISVGQGLIIGSNGF